MSVCEWMWSEKCDSIQDFAGQLSDYWQVNHFSTPALCAGVYVCVHARVCAGVRVCACAFVHVCVRMYVCVSVCQQGTSKGR